MRPIFLLALLAACSSPWNDPPPRPAWLAELDTPDDGGAGEPFSGPIVAPFGDGFLLRTLRGAHPRDGEPLRLWCSSSGPTAIYVGHPTEPYRLGDGLLYVAPVVELRGSHATITPRKSWGWFVVQAVQVDQSGVRVSNALALKAD